MAETVASALLRLRRKFESEGLASAALDARLLVQCALMVDHAELIASPGRSLSESETILLLQFEYQRSSGEPVSRIMGVREFYGREFSISKSVLDPRPDTETLIALCLKHVARDQVFRFVDLGAGSGAIAVTLLAECDQAQGVAVDLSAAALGYVKRNALEHGVLDRLGLVQSDWFSSVDGLFDLIVSNPPYIRRGDISELDVGVRGHDPLLALDGGVDGLDCYRLIAAGCLAHLSPGGIVAVEAGHDQSHDIKAIFRDNGFQVFDEAFDLAGFIRAIGFQRA
jgi:release factor glutamine methyltransferase